MKKSYQHIIKKSYTTPKIEEVEIDVAISLETPTDGGETTDPGGGTDNPVMPTSIAPKEPTYDTRSYQSPTSPFGDTSEPRY